MSLINPANKKIDIGVTYSETVLDQAVGRSYAETKYDDDASSTSIQNTVQDLNSKEAEVQDSSSNKSFWQFWK